ncbi:MAG: hypothetical protein A3I79_08405 [Gemmatimonadetes bacterium RIFCSPLOWO2_02_FULL_71_11]|nr:MAG: hypothetical protein A3I79_08405 [Gemmatimonadetes bacterium RIFCSPLOWO2_02_FULL_71_11]
MADKKGTVSIVYEESEDRPSIPVGGAYGGPSPDGTLVVAHLYTEFGTIPAMEEHDQEEDGKVDLSKGHQIKRGDVTRKVLATLVLSPEVAERVGKWLVQKSKMAMDRRKANPE